MRGRVHPSNRESVHVSINRHSITDADRDVGRRVAEIRAARGLTQRHLAAAIEIAPQRMSLLEGGRARILPSRLASIASALDVPVAALLADDRPAPGADHTALLAVPGAPELLRAYADIGDAAGRVAALRLVQSGVTRPTHATGTAGQ